MKLALRSHVAAALLLLPASAAFVALPAAAQSRSAYSIYEVAVRGSGGLKAGDMLFVRVTATATATSGFATLGRGGIRVALTEQSPGSYTGQHTINAGDRIDPRQPVMVQLTWPDGAVKARNGAFPAEFQALGRPAAAAPVARPERPEKAERPARAERPERPQAAKPTPPVRPAPPPVATAPSIKRFAVNPNNRVDHGRTLRFTLTGDARADASLEIPGVVTKVDLKETRPGTYEGSYTVRSTDKLQDFDKAVATLRRGDLRTTAQLELKAVRERPAREPRPDGTARPDRGTRPDGTARPPRPEGEPRTPRADRPEGEPRTPRADRPEGEPRTPRADRPEGEPRTPRADRPEGEPRTPRADRPAGEPPRNRDGRNPQVAP